MKNTFSKSYKLIFKSIIFILACVTFSWTLNDYSEVEIGNQIWMKKNLDINVFNNGDTIQEAKTAAEWNQADIDRTPAWCYYNNDKENGKKYGKLYNWYAVSDPRGLAPNGWHIPTEEEFWTLRNYLGGGQNNDGDKLKSATDDWYIDNGKSCKGSDSSGFSGLPSGLRQGGVLSEFKGLGMYANYWTTTKKNVGAYYIQLIAVGGTVYGNPSHYSYGMSVRCIKNNE